MNGIREVDDTGPARPTDRVDDLYKIVLIGNSGVGKTGLLQRFTENPDNLFQGLPTVGIDFKLRTIEIDGRKIKLQLWDTAGSERFRTLTTAFYRGAQGLLIVYDLTNPDSFDSVPAWVKLFREHSHLESGIPMILIANKSDREDTRQVSRSQGKILAGKYGMKYMETSARTGENVDQVFLTLATDIKKSRDRDFRVNQRNQRGSLKEDIRRIKIRPRSSSLPTSLSTVGSWFSKSRCEIL